MARPPLLSPHPPHRPASHGGAGPHPPPKAAGMIRPPRGRTAAPEREAGAGPAPTLPAAYSRRIQEEQANPRQRTRTPHGPCPGTASEHKPERYGGQRDTKDTRFFACPGEAEGRTEATRPPAPLASQAPQSGGTAHRPPPPLPPTPTPPTGAGTPQARGPTPRGAHSPKPGRGETGPGRPPPKASQTEHGTEAGRAEGHGLHATVLPAPSTGTARGARATPTRGGGGGGRRGSASAHTHKGHAGNTRRATGPSPRNAQYQRASERAGKGHPDRTARHTQRGTHGAGRGTQGRQDTRYRPAPPVPAAGAAHTRPEHCTRQSSSGAPRSAPAPRLGSLRASPLGN